MSYNGLISYILLPAFFFYTVLAPVCATAQSDEQIRQYRLLHKDEGYVTSPARRLTPINKSPENVVIITSKQIRNMNAHTVAEVLNRVPGLFVNFSGMDMGSPSLTYMEGSGERNILFLQDGMRLNFLNSGAAELNMIPVGVIERIEIIRGAASSTWGSSLAGVINLISKRGESLTGPKGLIQGSIGEGLTYDGRVEISGREIHLDYFVHGEFQKSDGLWNHREYKKCALFSKFNYRLSRSAEIGLSIGYGEPTNSLGELPSLDISTMLENRAFFAMATLDIALSGNIDLSLSLHHLKHKLTQVNDTLGLDGSEGGLYLNTVYDEATTEAKAKIIFSRGANTGVFGIDICHGALDQTLVSGAILQDEGAPPTRRTNPAIEEWAVYTNYTVDLGGWTLVPGIRYDWNDITGSFISPSLGATYQPEMVEETILRMSVARGFSAPPLAWTSGGGLLLDPNPSLEPEEVWSFQAGVESSVLSYLRIKATFFHHDVDKVVIADVMNPAPSTPGNIMINSGEIKRKGVEFETEAGPFNNCYAWAGLSYVDMESESASGDIYTVNLALRYNDGGSFHVELFGHYKRMDLEAGFGSNFDDFIWDLNMNKKLWSEGGESIVFFFTGHNLFDGSQYVFRDYKNPGRWFEAGFRYVF